MTGGVFKEELAQTCSDVAALRRALEAFLDVCQDVCTPTGSANIG